MKTIVIIGSGISGLSAAWLLRNKFPHHRILVLEKNAQPGGMLYVARSKGFHFDLGPKGFLTSGEGQWTLQLIQELGLSSKLVYNHPQAKQKFFHVHNKNHLISPQSLMKHGLCSSLLKDLFASKQTISDPSVEAFLRRHCSKKLFSHVIAPFITATKAGRCHLLSAQMHLPELLDREARHGSLVRSYLYDMLSHLISRRTKQHPSQLATLRSGMGSIIPHLVSKSQCILKLQHDVERIVLEPDHAMIKTNQGNFKADLVIFTGSIEQLTQTFSKRSPVLEKLKQYITPWHISCFAMGWHRKQLLKQHGYGILFADRPPLLGCVWNSSIFPETFGNRTCVSFILENRWHQDAAYSHCVAAANELLQISRMPDASALFSPDEGLPQHQPGFLPVREYMLSKLPKYMRIIGQNIYGPGLNHCIASAYQCVESIHSI